MGNKKAIRRRKRRNRKTEIQDDGENLGLKDFYITSVDHKWVKRILKKLEDRGFYGYHSEKYTLGTLKSSNRLHGVEDYRVKIIGFPPPSKQSNSNNYVANLAVELMKENDRVICVQTAKESIIPKYFSGLANYEGWDEDILCDRIAESIKSVKGGGSVRMSNMAEYTGDTVDSSTVNQELRTDFSESNPILLDDQPDIPVAPNNIIRGRRLMQLVKWVVGCSSVMLLIAVGIMNIKLILYIIIIMLMVYIAIIVVFPTLWSFYKSLSFIHKVVILTSVPVFVPTYYVLIIVGIWYNFATIQSFFKSLTIQKVAILASVLIIFGILYTRQSLFKSFSSGEIVAFAFSIVAIVVIIFCILKITAPLLKVLYALIILLFI